MSQSKAPILSVEGLSVSFPMPRSGIFGERQYLKAVRDISFDVPAGKTLGIVGESGSGKTTAAMATIRLTEAQAGVAAAAQGEAARAKSRRSEAMGSKAAAVEP